MINIQARKRISFKCISFAQFAKFSTSCVKFKKIQWSAISGGERRSEHPNLKQESVAKL